MESNSSQVKIYTDYSDTTFIGKFTILPICFRSLYQWDNSGADFTYILETWASSCQPPEGYECLVCDQQYLVLRYWNEKLKTQFARHKKINPEESSSKSSFWFRSTENLKHMTCNLYIKNKNIHLLSHQRVGYIVGDDNVIATLFSFSCLNKDIFVANIEVAKTFDTSFWALP